MSWTNRRYYRAKANAWAFGTTNDGKPQIGVGFEVLEENAPQEEKHLTWYGYFSDAAFDRTIESLRHMGWQGEDLAELDEGGPGRLDINEVSLVVDDEEYEGKWRVKVQFVNRLGGGAAVKNRMDAQTLQAFAGEMRGKIRALNASQGRPSAPVGQRSQQRAPTNSRPPPRQPEPPPHTDDDIPF